MKVITRQTDSRWIFKVYEGKEPDVNSACKLGFEHLDYLGEIRVPRFSTSEQIQKQAEEFALNKANERLTKAFNMTF